MASNRRNYQYLNTNLELRIDEIINDIENLGAHPNLTNAQIKLQEAKDELSEFIDHQIKVVD